MKTVRITLMSLFMTSVAAFASTLTAPVFTPDGQTVSPVGQMFAGTPGLNLRVCGNEGTDHDFNDVCGIAAFHSGGLFTLTYEGGTSALFDSLGVVGQPGLVNAITTSQAYFYLPILPVPFKLVTPTNTYTIGNGFLNSDGQPHIWEGVATPEPMTVAMVGAGLVTVLWSRRKQLTSLRSK